MARHGETGLVTCRAVGAAIITVVLTAEPVANDAATVQCEAVPAPVGLIQISTGSLTFTHVVGTTTCPQTVGTVVVTNVSGEAVQVTTTGHTALALDPSSFTLAAGASRTVTVRFNCATQQSFVVTVTFRGSAGSQAQNRTLQVTGTISQ